MRSNRNKKAAFTKPTPVFSPLADEEDKRGGTCCLPWRKKQFEQSTKRIEKPPVENPIDVEKPIDVQPSVEIKAKRLDSNSSVETSAPPPKSPDTPVFRTSVWTPPQPFTVPQPLANPQPLAAQEPGPMSQNLRSMYSEGIKNGLKNSILWHK